MAQALTPKQEAFCHKFLELKDASKAYRACYNVGPNTKPTTIWRTAKSILDNPKVSARIKELQQPAADAVTLTLAEHLAELADIRNKAKEAGQFSAATNAETSRGKAAGLYTQKHDVRVVSGVEDFLYEVGK